VILRHLHLFSPCGYAAESAGLTAHMQTTVRDARRMWAASSLIRREGVLAWERRAGEAGEEIVMVANREGKAL